MGLILDSSTIIDAERRKETVPQVLRRIASLTGDQRFAISAVGFTEIVHALWRTQTPSIREARQRFIDEWLIEAEIVPYTRVTAMLAGRIDAEQRSVGITIPIADLLIGATALEHGYAVVTINVRHFRLIPGLTVLTP
jgi:tRNA(fMet)-specific endonuclease VapC